MSQKLPPAPDGMVQREQFEYSGVGPVPPGVERRWKHCEQSLLREGLKVRGLGLNVLRNASMCKMIRGPRDVYREYWYGDTLLLRVEKWQIRPEVVIVWRFMTPER